MAASNQGKDGVVSPTNRDKLLLSNIERFINRKIEVGVHTVKQLTCKNETVNKFEMPPAKKRKIE